MNKLALALAVVALAVALFAAFRPAGTAAPDPVVEEEGEAGELAYHMAYLQRYADKLHFAGAAGNWELASFYLHEIEETNELVIEENHVEDGIEVGPLAGSMLLPAVERAEAAVEAQDPAAFTEAYAGLVTACNACHEATAHGFIRITVPEEPGYPNQSFD